MKMQKMNLIKFAAVLFFVFFVAGCKKEYYITVANKSHDNMYFIEMDSEIFYEDIIKDKFVLWFSPNRRAYDKFKNENSLKEFYTPRVPVKLEYGEEYKLKIDKELFDYLKQRNYYEFYMICKNINFFENLYSYTCHYESYIKEVKDRGYVLKGRLEDNSVLFEYFTMEGEQVLRMESIPYVNYHPARKPLHFGPDIVNLKNDSDIYYYGLKTTDSGREFKTKLLAAGKKIKDGTDYAGIYKIYNEGIILEEGINCDFLTSFYKNQLFSFIKFSLPIEEVRHIVQNYGSDFDLNKLQRLDTYEMKLDNWKILIQKISEENYTYLLINSEYEEEINNLYMSFEN